MTAEFELLMHLMGAASRGGSTPPPHRDINWDTLFTLAREQQILPLICHSVATQELHSCPDVLPMVLAHCARNGSVIALLEDMNHAGIPCYVVKGFAAGIPYAAPEYRLSGDTDIVVSPEDEEKACLFLEQHGFSIQTRWKHGHHDVASHPKMGIIEVHVRLYDEIVNEVWFQNLDTDALLQEPKQLIHTSDGDYWTLGPTDHAIYMALHMVKHFILSGNSLRMMMDVSLALASQRDILDLNRFWNTLDTLHYGTLLRTILWAMVQYCGFQPEDFPGIGPRDEDAMELILSDLETGGWLGRNDKNAREAGWHDYNRQLLMKSKNKLQYRLYMLNWAHSFRITTLFPGKKRLSRDYPVVLKHPGCIPLVWIHRIIFRGIPLLFQKNPVFRSNPDENASSRMSLFRRLDMIE